MRIWLSALSINTSKTIFCNMISFLLSQQSTSILTVYHVLCQVTKKEEEILSKKIAVVGAYFRINTTRRNYCLLSPRSLLLHYHYSNSISLTSGLIITFYTLNFRFKLPFPKIVYNFILNPSAKGKDRGKFFRINFIAPPHSDTVWCGVAMRRRRERGRSS